MSIEKRVQALNEELQAALAAALTVDQIEVIRVAFIGKKGSITQLMQEMKTLPVEQKRSAGPLLNELKRGAEQKIKDAKAQLVMERAAQEEAKKQHFDVTAYLPQQPQGHLHPFTPFIEEIENIFLSMGFDIFDGPEIENDHYNFGALNIPQDHPARDMYDTFWLDVPNMLLRTHTSPVQIHAMETNALPLAGITIGRVYRHEAVDASHDYMFMQCEGVMIGENIRLSHLLGTAQHFLKTLFKTDSLDIRIRPGFFPFVEPGVEIDMRCQFCSDGCSVCKKSTWLEVFPGGMIHPNVLKAANIDPEKQSGFAFGFGLTRLAMLRYGINDIRHFYSGKNSFLHQF